MSAKRDRTTGLPLPSPVVPATSICLTISVPNALEYRSALKGALSELGKAWTWSQTAGQANEDSYAAAEMWRERIANAIYQLDCGETMNCADVADCIENDAAVQAALALQIASNPVIYDQIGNQAVQGVPLSAAELNAPLSSAPGCDQDVLFGSITAIVEQLNTNNEDFLEMLEARTNVIERISLLIAAIPIFETLPANEVIDFIDKLFEDVVENYRGQYTTELKDEYRCDLFCLAQAAPDCELTFDMIVKYFEDRLGQAFSDEELFRNLIEYFVLGTWTGTRVADIMHLLQVGIWRAASSFIGLRIRTLQTVGLLGANDPDPDWEILCEDCPPPPSGEWEIYPYDPGPYTWGTIVAQTSNSITVQSTLSTGFHRLCVRRPDDCVEILTVTSTSPTYWVKSCGDVPGTTTPLVPGDIVSVVVMSDPSSPQEITFTW